MTTRYHYYFWVGSDAVNQLIAHTLDQQRGHFEPEDRQIKKDSNNQPARKTLWPIGCDSDLKDALTRSLNGGEMSYKLYRSDGPDGDIVYVKKVRKKKQVAKKRSS